ncbi:MAG: hypothetical protein JWN04_469 [Myxococcaceae bacterium]|nr:hypothetical protein [Myxococcaceae bacterium]
MGESVWVPSGLDDSAPDDPTQPKKRKLKVRISLFFDGTSNSRKNTEARLAATNQPQDVPSAADRDRDRDKAIAAYQKYGEGEENSYANDHSNVSRLEMYVDHALQAAAGYDYYFCHYIEGIGTVDLEDDHVLVGQAFGAGATGMKAKVQRGLDKAVAAIDKTLEGAAELELVVDTFGFSRGAAAARYCIYRALHDEKKTFSSLFSLKSSIESATPHTISDTRVHAVGLWDTVASYGFDHTDNTPALKLDSVREAKAILQLAAAEEYRVNFALTNIASVDGGKGQQVYLPGAHSDVGGSYPDMMHPRNTAEYAECKSIAGGSSSGAIAAFMLERGWYKANQLRHRVKSEWLGKNLIKKQSVDVERQRISRQYSFVPLHIMADFSEKQELPVKPELKTKYDPSLVPSALKQRIESYAQQKLTSLASDWDKNDPELADLRNRFLHVSSSTSIGMGMRTMNAGPGGKERPVREVFDG